MSEEPPSDRKPERSPALPPSDRPAIAAAPSPASLPESGRPALPAGTPPAPDPRREAIETLLRVARTIAVVGASDKPGKPSHRVAFYLMRAGFEVYPVNPTIKALGERPAFPDLKSVPVRIDIVDIFRRPEQVPPVIDEAIAVGAKAVWMQEGIVNEEAAARARAAGLVVVMDRCVMKEHRRMAGLHDGEKGPRRALLTSAAGPR
ncbi:MAG: CoA-binding protein [Euryarchaeota archaeon]|nr:CoA-binding protein [Euryarchaeota archaeon]